MYDYQNGLNRNSETHARARFCKLTKINEKNYWVLISILITLHINDRYIQEKSKARTFFYQFISHWPNEMINFIRNNKMIKKTRSDFIIMVFSVSIYGKI